jgi:hypothetical protein
MAKGHVHHWILTRSSPITKGLMKGKTAHFFECISPGCPKPNKMEIS